MIQPVIYKTALTQIEHCNVVIQMASQGLDERRLARSWWTIEQVSSSIRYTALVVPLRRREEILHIGHDAFLDTLVQNHRFQWPLAPRMTKFIPFCAPRGVDDSLA